MGSRLALFPGGVVGLGLLLLRVSVAVSTLLLTASLQQTSDFPQFVGVPVAIGLCGGLQTRALAGLSLLAALLCAVYATAPGLAAVHAISAAALSLTGSGAFSLDARLFGRRTVRLPASDDTKV